ncbi:MAG: hypothetical protein JXR83_15980 [Deltaproteobacteria bacterium]|nr:hypothetical protein [Deltaproteobacteria bacterium]
MNRTSAPGWKTILDPEASDPLARFKHQSVIVHANGIKYQGVLIGADEQEIYLRTETRYLTIRMELVSKLELFDATIEFDPARRVDPDFYRTDDLDPDDEGRG